MEPNQLLDSITPQKSKRAWEVALNCFIFFYLAHILWIFVGYLIDKMASPVNPLLPSYTTDYIADSNHMFNSLKGVIECSALLLAYIFKLFRLPIISVSILIAGFIAAHFSFHLLIP